MKAFYTAAFAAGASAAVVSRADQCCFQLTATGGVSGTLGQLDDGQNRVGGNHPTGTYCINNGAITDGNGRGCILTPPTTQFQCDTGATPTKGFMVGSNGQLEYNGDETFYACPADDSMYNIYTKPVDNQPKCVKVMLNTGGKCVPQKPMTNTCPAPSTVYKTMTEVKTEYKTEFMTKTDCQMAPASPTSMPPQQSSSMAPKQSSSMPPAQSSSMAPPPPKSSACPKDLSGPYQYPHLIVPVSSSNPNKAYGTQYNATISSDTCSIFNFDVPQSYAGKTCSLTFLFPQQSQLQTSSFDFSGEGSLEFYSLSSPATQQTTYANMPSKMHIGSASPMPGNGYTISTYDCPAGKTPSIEVCGAGGLDLEYFQDYNPSPIGLYITAC